MPEADVSILDILEMLKQLSNNSFFQKWAKEHPKNHLTHFFVAIDQNYHPLAGWEIGYYEKDSKKIKVFMELVMSDAAKKAQEEIGSEDEEMDFMPKDADAVFQKETVAVEELNLKQAKLTFQEAVKICQEQLPKLFPKEQTGNGFVILQTWKQKTLWNFTFITQTIKFINLKINAEDGSVAENNRVELIDKKQSTSS